VNQISAEDLNLPNGFASASPFSSQFRRKVGAMVPLGDINGGDFKRKVKGKAPKGASNNYTSDNGTGFDGSLGLSPQEIHAMQIGDANPELAADAAHFLGL
jgi:hypothetical protein